MDAGQRMTIGIFGGAFNPPHMGHLIVAEAVGEQLHLDKVIFVVSADPPHRRDVGRATAEARFTMTKLAVRGNTRFDLSDMEIQRPGKSYTVDTVLGFEALHPRARLFLLIGSDNLAEFHTWRSPREIIARCELVAFTRPGFPMDGIKNEFVRSAQVLTAPIVGISASDIRRRVKTGRSIRYMVPEAVEDYIVKKGLYRE